MALPSSSISGLLFFERSGERDFQPLCLHFCQQVTEKGHFPQPEIPESGNVAWEVECLVSKVPCLKGWGRHCFGGLLGMGGSATQLM